MFSNVQEEKIGNGGSTREISKSAIRWGKIRVVAAGNEFRTREREEDKVCMWIDRTEKRYSNIGLRVKISVTCLHNRTIERVMQRWDVYVPCEIYKFATY